MNNIINQYKLKISSVINNLDINEINNLADIIKDIWENDKQIFLCGNGGSAANAIHFCNDLIYGISEKSGKGMRVYELSSNSSITTCLANDIGYERLFEFQLNTLATHGDILLIFSGSGNSINLINAITKAKEIGVKTYAILGFNGGRCLKMVDKAIHIPIDDMQISEDIQQIICHMISRKLMET